MRYWHSWQRHVTLSMMAHAWLASVRHKATEKKGAEPFLAELTVPEVRRLDEGWREGSMRFWRAERGNGLASGVLATALMILVVGALYDVYAAHHYRTWGYQPAGAGGLAGTLAGT